MESWWDSFWSSGGSRFARQRDIRDAVERVPTSGMGGVAQDEGKERFMGRMRTAKSHHRRGEGRFRGRFRAASPRLRGGSYP